MFDYGLVDVFVGVLEGAIKEIEHRNFLPIAVSISALNRKFKMIFMNVKMFLCVFLFVLGSCTEEIKISEEQIFLIKNKYSEYTHYDTKNDFIVFERNVQVGEFYFKEIYVNSDGTFFQVKSYFATEHGFFVPKEGHPVETGKGKDPEYTNLGNGVYKYKIRG